MIRNLYGLQKNMQEAAKKIVDEFKDATSHELLIYSTKRTFEEQAILYRSGRRLDKIENKAKELSKIYDRADLAGILLNAPPQYGKRILTYAGPGQSLHNYGFAFDAVPMVAGKPLWETTDKNRYYWEIYGSLVVECGLEWAGNWVRFKEYPHAQDKSVKWKNLI